MTEAEKEAETKDIPNEELLGTPMSPSDEASRNVELLDAEVIPDGEIDSDLLAKAEAIADQLISDPDALQGILSQPGDGATGGTIVEADPVLLKAMEEIKYGATILQKGRLNASYAFKYDLEEKSKIVYDILLSVRPFNETLTMWPLSIDTPYGPMNTSGYIIWNNIVGISYDEMNKRTVPVKLILMTPSFGFKDVNVVALSQTVTTEMILETIDAVDVHRSMIVAEEGRTARKEAKTYKEVVDRIYEIAYPNAVEDMASKAMEAEDRGDKGMKSAFTVDKDIWETIRENWCIILFALIFLAIMVYSAMGGGY